METTEQLPPFSGPCPPCKKCGLPKGKAVGTTTRYFKEGESEYVRRCCGQCGYSWHERCADEDWVQCSMCQGCAHPPILGARPLCEWCQRQEAYMWRTTGPSPDLAVEEEN